MTSHRISLILSQSNVAPYTSPTTASPKSKKNSSFLSSPLSAQSNFHTATRVSVRKGSVSHSLAGSDINDSLADFPLPGSAPLLPPSRDPARVARKSQSVDALRLHIDTSKKHNPVSEAVPEVVLEEEPDDAPMYLLQPLTYTPKLPAPVPSPMKNDTHTPSPRIDSGAFHQSPGSANPKPVPARQANQNPPWGQPNPGPVRESSQNSLPSKSIRHRVSLRRAVPQDIRIPSSNSNNHSHSRAESRPSLVSPRMSNNSSHPEVRESAGSGMQQYRESSGSEASSFQQHVIPRVASHAELRPVRPTLMQSPNSDYQHYHPVRASPHSPLQQRPHTAVGAHSNRPSGYFPSNQPSRLGSIAPMENFDNRTLRSQAPSVAPTATTNRTLKKKKSAFGWFKKAFTMDEEEKAAFEARRNFHSDGGAYYKDKDPKFLDGKRMR